MSVRKLNEQLEKGILPIELNFSVEQQNNIIDFEKLKYNAFYRSYEFYENKFPKGYENIPGFNKIIENIALQAEEENKTPLQEIIERQNIIKSNDIDECN